MTQVRKAVIPAAGLGTRFLPATKSQPKEMIPVIDKPGIQYVVEEVVRAGIEDILIVSSRNKGSMEDHFDRSLELEQHLQRVGKIEEYEAVKALGELADIHFIRQKEPRGFGDAVMTARPHVSDEPFLALVGDEIVPEPAGNEKSLAGEMLRVFTEKQASVIAVLEVPKEDTSSYGCIGYDNLEGQVARITEMVEKPSPEDAPSRLASRGRYVFSPDIFEAIEKTSQGVGGEIQLTDAINTLAQEQEVFAYVHDGPVYDVGKKLDYLKTMIELALRRDDLAAPIKSFLLERAEQLR